MNPLFFLVLVALSLGVDASVPYRPVTTPRSVVHSQNSNNSTNKTTVSPVHLEGEGESMNSPPPPPTFTNLPVDDLRKDPECAYEWALQAPSLILSDRLRLPLCGHSRVCGEVGLICAVGEVDMSGTLRVCLKDPKRGLRWRKVF